MRRTIDRELREPLWIQMTEADAAVLREQHEKSEGQLIPRHCFFC